MRTEPPAVRVAVVGSVNVDLVARCPVLPAVGETVLGATFERLPGGKGANQALAARRLGARVELIACVGDDELAGPALAGLAAGAVGLDGVQTVEGSTGVAVILVAADGENMIAVAPGANARLSPDMAQAGGAVRSADVVLTQLEVPVETVLAAAAGTTGMLVLNAAPALAVPDELLDRADLVIVNEVEAAGLGARVDRLPLVAITYGARGAELRALGRELVRATPPAVVAVDAVGAGDAFCAALAVSLAEGRDHGDALSRACAAGALAASRPGAQASLPTAAEVDALASSP